MCVNRTKTPDLCVQLPSVGQEGRHRWHLEENVWLLGCQLVSAEKGRGTSPRPGQQLLEKQMGARGLLTGPGAAVAKALRQASA